MGVEVGLLLLGNLERQSRGGTCCQKGQSKELHGVVNEGKLVVRSAE